VHGGRDAGGDRSPLNGTVFIEIGKFAQSRIGEQSWRDVLKRAAIPERVYYRVADYPDAEASAQLAALASALHEPLGDVIESLGEFIAPDLLRMARYWIEPQWKTLDLIANTELTIHETCARKVRAPIRRGCAASASRRTRSWSPMIHPGVYARLRAASSRVWRSITPRKSTSWSRTAC
jgi:hypothetical protein